MALAILWENKGSSGFLLVCSFPRWLLDAAMQLVLQIVVAAACSARLTLCAVSGTTEPYSEYSTMEQAILWAWQQQSHPQSPHRYIIWRRCYWTEALGHCSSLHFLRPVPQELLLECPKFWLNQLKHLFFKVCIQDILLNLLHMYWEQTVQQRESVQWDDKHLEWRVEGAQTLSKLLSCSKCMLKHLFSVSWSTHWEC